ncbi:MAG: shikimate-5-dehydrogenase [Frankiales bacterium]|nr:shikimate-5-dehydrogenase [Frankiales bacterium]
MTARRAAVLGSPIAHSLSPLLHRAAYDALDLDWRYDAIEVTADGLPRFVAALTPEWVGLSLTMPLKVAVLPLLTRRSALVETTGAANTVVLREGELLGDNTDVAGLLTALREAGITEALSPVVLGGGATACSALVALRELGCVIPTLVVRSPPTAALATAARLGMSPIVIDADRADLAGAGLVISTLPAGAADRWATQVRDVPALLDVVYDPWPTAIAAACQGTVIMGSAMLLHQAAAQVELMTGQPAPLPAMRAALEGRSSLGPVPPKG